MNTKQNNNFSQNTNGEEGSQGVLPRVDTLPLSQGEESQEIREMSFDIPRVDTLPLSQVDASQDPTQSLYRAPTYEVAAAAAMVTDDAMVPMIRYGLGKIPICQLCNFQHIGKCAGVPPQPEGSLKEIFNLTLTPDTPPRRADTPRLDVEQIQEQFHALLKQHSSSSRDLVPVTNGNTRGLVARKVAKPNPIITPLQASKLVICAETQRNNKESDDSSSDDEVVLVVPEKKVEVVPEKKKNVPTTTNKRLSVSRFKHLKKLHGDSLEKSPSIVSNNITPKNVRETWVETWYTCLAGPDEDAAQVFRDFVHNEKPLVLNTTSYKTLINKGTPEFIVGILPTMNLKDVFELMLRTETVFQLNATVFKKTLDECRKEMFDKFVTKDGNRPQLSHDMLYMMWRVFFYSLYEEKRGTMSENAYKPIWDAYVKSVQLKSWPIVRPLLLGLPVQLYKTFYTVLKELPNVEWCVEEKKNLQTRVFDMDARKKHDTKEDDDFLEKVHLNFCGVANIKFEKHLPSAQAMGVETMLTTETLTNEIMKVIDKFVPIFVTMWIMRSAKEKYDENNDTFLKEGVLAECLRRFLVKRSYLTEPTHKIKIMPGAEYEKELDNIYKAVMTATQRKKRARVEDGEKASKRAKVEKPDLDDVVDLVEYYQSDDKSIPADKVQDFVDSLKEMYGVKVE